MAVYFPADRQGLFVRARAVWGMKDSSVIVAKILHLLGIPDTPVLRNKIAANLLLADCIRKGRVAHDKVREAAFLVFELISPSQRPSDLSPSKVEQAINKVRESKVYLGLGGMPLRLLLTTDYHYLRRLVLDGRGLRKVSRRVMAAEAETQKQVSLASEIESLQRNITELEQSKEALLAGLEAATRLVQGSEALTRATLRAVDLDSLLHEVAQIAYRTVGCDRAIIFMYDKDRNALVAKKNPRGSPYAGKNQAKIADIEAFLEGELIVPLDAKGQKALSHKLIRRAIELAPARQLGGDTARRLLKNIPLLIRGYRSKGRELAGREAELSAEYEIQERFMRANLAALEYGFQLDYEGEGKNKKVVLSKNIVSDGGGAQKVVLEEFLLSGLHAEPELTRMRDKGARALEEVLASETLAEMLLGTVVLRRFFNRSRMGIKSVPVISVGEQRVIGRIPSKALWEKIREPSESIISLTFKTGQSYRVKVDDPQVKINPALIAMWDTIAFAAVPIIARRVVEKGGGKVETEEVVGIIGLDNDVSRTEFSDEAMGVIQMFADMVALQCMLFRYRASLEDVVKGVLREGAGEELQRTLHEGGRTTLSEGLVEGVVMHTGVYGKYEASSGGLPSIERPAHRQDETPYPQFLERFKMVVEGVASSFGGVLVGGDERSAYLFWGAERKQDFNLANFAGRALEASFALSERLERLKSQAGLSPPVFFCTGMIADSIRATVVEGKERSTIVARVDQVARVKRIAERGGSGAVMIAPEVAEGLDKNWETALMDNAVKGVAHGLPRAHLARKLINEQREEIRNLVLAMISSQEEALDRLLERVVSDESKKEEIKNRRENVKVAILSGTLQLLYNECDLMGAVLLTPQQINHVYDAVIGDLEKYLRREAKLLVEMDFGQQQLFVRLLSQLAICRVEAGRSPEEVVGTAEEMMGSIIKHREEFRDQRGLMGEAQVQSLIKELLEAVVSAPQIYEEALEKMTAGGSGVAVDSEPERIEAAERLIHNINSRLRPYWCGDMTGILYSNAAFSPAADFRRRWSGIFNEGSNRWRQWNQQGDRTFEEYFIAHIGRLVEQRSLTKKGELSPMAVIGAAEVRRDESLIGGAYQVDTKGGFLRPVLNLENGRPIGYSVDYSMDPKSTAFSRIAEGVCDLLVLRYLERTSS